MSARCRSCEAPVIWATSAAGKKMPMDAEPTDKGTFVLLPGNNVRKADVDDRVLLRPTYTCHFATCPDADDFRSKR